MVVASLCELHSSSAACSKYIHAGFSRPVCNVATFLCVTSTHVMRTFARSTCIPKRDIYIHTNSSRDAMQNYLPRALIYTHGQTNLHAPYEQRQD